MSRWRRARFTAIVTVGLAALPSRSSPAAEREKVLEIEPGGPGPAGGARPGAAAGGGRVLEPEWIEYLGGRRGEAGRHSDAAHAVAVDAAGNLYIVGWTQSFDFPSSGAFRDSYSGGVWSGDQIFDDGHHPVGGDGFVAKYRPDGHLVWSTYLGGREADYARDVAIDRNGDVYIVGQTASSDFPVRRAHDDTYNGRFKPNRGYKKSVRGITFCQDAFVCKFSPTGALRWSTFLGGTEREDASIVETDGAGSVYVAGHTSSADFAGEPCRHYVAGGDEEPFVAKFSGDGTLLWACRLGGSSYDRLSDLAVDRAGCVYLTGWTASLDFPTTRGFDPTFGGGAKPYEGDAFLAKLAGDGSLVWSTYLGGSQKDYGSLIVANRTGDVLVIGFTRSPDFPTKGPDARPYGDSESRRGACFIARFAADGTLLWSTCPPGDWPDRLQTVELEDAGELSIAGWVRPLGAGWEWTAPRFRPVAAASWFRWIARIGSDGRFIEFPGWASAIQGSHCWHGATFDAAGNLYVVGGHAPGRVHWPDAYLAKFGAGDLRRMRGGSILVKP